jgi:hypothetical protein
MHLCYGLRTVHSLNGFVDLGSVPKPAGNRVRAAHTPPPNCVPNCLRRPLSVETTSSLLELAPILPGKPFDTRKLRDVRRH